VQLLESPVRLPCDDGVSTDRVFRDRMVERFPKVRLLKGLAKASSE
jgi:hypothetical protein